METVAEEGQGGQDGCSGSGQQEATSTTPGQQADASQNPNTDAAFAQQPQPPTEAPAGSPLVPPSAAVPQHMHMPVLPPPVPHHRQRVAPGLTEAYMTQSIMPQHANTLGITFGGQVGHGREV